MTNPLEEWIHSAIRSQALRDPKLREYLGIGSSTAIDRSVVDRYVSFKLREVASYAYERSPFYKNLFRRKKVTPNKIKTIDDFSTIPFTDPEDIENPYNFLCVSQSEILRGFTTGEPTEPGGRRFLFMKDELEHIVSSIAAGLKMVGMERDNTVLIAFPRATLWDCSWLVERAVRRGGGSPTVTNPTDYDKLAQEVRKVKPSILIGANPHIQGLTKSVRGTRNVSGLGVKAFILSRGCEYYPFNENIRGEIQSVWNCKAYDHYGTTETGFAFSIECPQQNGLHINEADFFAEIVDPVSGEPLRPGEEGELVFTTLTRRGMPLLRYRSGDISRLIREPCKCGANTIQRMDGTKAKIRGKAEEYLFRPLI